MACALNHLSVLAYAQGFTLWCYKAGLQTLDAVAERGFFDPASELLAIGDMLMVSSQAGGRMLCVASCRDGVLTAALA